MSNKNDMKLKCAFSLAEMMVVMLIMSIVLAAMAPLITTRIKADQALKAGEADAAQEDNNPWQWVEGSDTDAYSQASRNMIGQSAAEENDGDAMLILNKGKDDRGDILFKNSKGNFGRLDVWNLSSNNQIDSGGIVLGATTPGTASRSKSGGTSIGFDNTLGGTWSAVVGYKNSVEGYSRVFGFQNTVKRKATVIGDNNNVDGNGLYVLGIGTITTVQQASGAVLGINNQLSGESYLLGRQNTAAGSYALGQYNNLTAYGSVVVGKDNTTTSGSCYIFGEKNSLSGKSFSMAVGKENEVTGEDNIAIGRYASATGYHSLAIGVEGTIKDSRTEPATTASSDYSVAIGYRSLSSGSYSIALGSHAKASGESSIAISANKFNNDYAVASGKYSVAIGYKAQATSDYEIALGSSNNTVKIPGKLYVNGTNVTSDKRLKYIKGENKNGLDAIKKIKVYDFTFKKDENKEPRVGVIAQELQKILPDAVKKGSDGFLTIRIDDIIYTLVNAVKELDRKVSELTETLKQVQSEQKQIRAEQKRINQRLDALQQKSVH